LELHDRISKIGIIQKRLKRFLEQRIDIVKPFYKLDGNCFLYRRDENGQVRQSISPSSTATCVYVLNEWGQLTEIVPDSNALRNNLLTAEWNTANLGVDNLYTQALVLPALHILNVDPKHDRIKKAINNLKKAINDGNGGITLTPSYKGTKSAFISWWGAMSLKDYSNEYSVNDEIDMIVEWAKREMYRQISYFKAPWSDMKNIHQLGFAWAICEKFCENNPIPAEISELVLSIIFADQNRDGVWPRYYPLFNFPTAGAAYVYHFELVLAILWAISHKPQKLQHYLENIERIIGWVETRNVYYDKQCYGWTISSDPTVRFQPISWATVEVLHSLFLLDKYLANIQRELIFEKLSGESTSTQQHSKRFSDVYEMEISINRNKSTVLKEIKDKVVEPIRSNGKTLLHGNNKNAALNILLFGPPGTSKSTLARVIAGELGWPLLEMDPSNFASRDGNGFEAKVIEIFSYLDKVYDAVIFLDEIDEMVRDRTQKESDRVGRLWTTLMLPRLSKLRETGRAIIVVATNYINRIDWAAKRPGRFDMVIPVGPPCIEGKLEYIAKKLGKPHEEIKEMWSKISAGGGAPVECLGHILFGELDGLIRELKGTNDDITQDRLKNVLVSCSDGIYLHLKNEDGSKNWDQFIDWSNTYARLA